MHAEKRFVSNEKAAVHSLVSIVSLSGYVFYAVVSLAYSTLQYYTTLWTLDYSAQILITERMIVDGHKRVGV